MFSKGTVLTIYDYFYLKYIEFMNYKLYSIKVPDILKIEPLKA